MNIPCSIRTGIIFALGLLALRSSAAEASMSDVIRDDFAFADAQYTRMLDQLKSKDDYPRSWDPKGGYKFVRYTDWTSGFFPGSLWYIFEGTGDKKWSEAAAKFTAGVTPAKDNRGTHDVGFVLYTSCGNGLRLTGNKQYRDVLLTGAASLSTRFNPIVGCIKSWDGRKQWDFPVIIDNMMNLELLMWAAKAGNEPKFREIAISHADTTLRNHFRPDGSSFHVVDYDPATGKVKSRVTHQGAADDSAWARGQAWGLYGYTMMYRETHNPVYLAHAQKIAAFIMNHPRLPADKIPYWDFDAPGIPNVPRDASAAAVMSSALLELRTFVDAEAAARYTSFAEQQLRMLSSPAYRAKLGENGCFLLMHSTGNHPQGTEIDVPINYGDYYFLEALLRWKAGAEKK
jgi:unsaturated chondroitin disaccharide hydrolase